MSNLSKGLVPMYERVLVKVIDPEEKSVGGIILPDTAKEKPQEGVVIEVGHGKPLGNGKFSKIAIDKGDRILFSKYAGTEIKFQEENYLIVKSDEVLAKYRLKGD